MVLRRDALPLKRSEFTVPEIIWRECQLLLQEDAPAEPHVLSEPDRGLHAVIRLSAGPAAPVRPPVCAA